MLPRSRSGSSPRMRGALDIIYVFDSSERDHPRGCGEHVRAVHGQRFEQGSSPRMRGALISPGSLSRSTWIIPADAGSTDIPRIAFQIDMDHPRGCGEHKTCDTPGLCTRGSSPRMRGAHGVRSLREHERRIIPADAGSTRSRCAAPAGYPDHPRGCGEHSPLSLTLFQDTGSSPRMRGAQGFTYTIKAVMRIIPADAGSTAQAGH